MGPPPAAHEIPLRLWLEAIQAEALQNPKLNPDSETDAAMLNRLDGGLEDLNAFVEYLVTTPPAKLRCSGGFSNSQMRVADSQAGYPLSLHSQQTLVQASVVPDSKC